MGVKSAIRRQRIGKRIDLETIRKDDDSPYWVTPQKLDVATQDEIQSEVLSAKDLMKSIAGNGDLSSDSIAKLAENVNVEQFRAVRRIFTLRLQKGVADHNLDDDAGNVIAGMPDDLIDAILDLPELANEIHKIVTEHNSPLAQKTVKS